MRVSEQSGFSLTTKNWLFATFLAQVICQLLEQKHVGNSQEQKTKMQSTVNVTIKNDPGNPALYHMEFRGVKWSFFLSYHNLIMESKTHSCLRQQKKEKSTQSLSDFLCLLAVCLPPDCPLCTSSSPSTLSSLQTHIGVKTNYKLTL